MIITENAMRALERNQRRTKADHYWFTFETINGQLWLRIEFGDLFMPVITPANFNSRTATLDYGQHCGHFVVLE